MAEEEEIHQPHDKLFIQGFSRPENAAALLSSQFPAALADAIDWEALTLRSNSFVDSHYRASEADLLFSTQFIAEQRPCLVYLLFEHQSTPDTLMALRLLRYMVRIWEAFLKENPGQRLPVVLPVVLAQNAERWEIKCQLTDLLDLPESEVIRQALRLFIPDFCFKLLQLAEVPFEALPSGTPSATLILRVMKAERLGRLLDDVVWDELLMGQVPGEVLEMLLRYILDADIDKEAFEHRIGSIQNQQTRSNAMSLAQVYRQEGRKEGRKEGRAEGSALVTLRQIRRKFPAIAGQAAPLVQRLNEERLMAFSEALLFMNSAEDCLQWLTEGEV